MMLRDTLYAKYIKDREGLEILEDDFGFVTYKLQGQECFIANICIDPDNRRQGGAREFVKQLEDIAKAGGCLALTGVIDLKDPGANNTLHAALHIGFEVNMAQGDKLFIVKELGGKNG